jgi:O-antigen/teichoic acid export membrane protein/lauroyl/myristoyl acyltransferase
METKSEPARLSPIARNVIANWIAFLFVALVSFFLSPFVVHHLGATAYGVWSLLASVVGYLGLLDFGVRGAVTRYVAHHHSAGDDKQASSIVSAGLVMFGFLGLLAILLSGIVAILSPLLFHIPVPLVDDTRMVLMLGGLTVAATLIGAVFGGVVTGLQRFDVSSGLEIVMTTVRAIAVVFALRHGHGIVSIALIHLAISILQGLAYHRAARKLYPRLRLRIRAPLRPHMRSILSFSVLLSMIHLFGVVIYYSDAIVIAAFLPIGAVTIFAIAGNLCEYARQVASALSRLMTPRASALASVGSGKLADEILAAGRIATLATAPIAAIFWFRGAGFIDLWMGSEYGTASGEILRLLSIVVWLGGARSVASASIIGVNRHRELIPILAGEAVCNLALSVALVKIIGLNGVAWGTLVPSVVVSLWYVPRCLSQTTGVPVGLFYRNAWFLPTLACVPFLLVNVFFEHSFPASNLLEFFLQVTLTLPLVALGACLCLTRAERRALILWMEKRAGSRGMRAKRFVARARLIGRAIHSIREFLNDYLLTGLLYLIVRPAARVLSVTSIKRMCRTLARFVVFVSPSGTDILELYVAAFGVTRTEATVMTVRNAAEFLWEYATHIHLARHPGWYRGTKCVQVNPEALERAMEAGGSIIIATGHFARDESIMWMLDSETLPREVTYVLGPYPSKRWMRPRSLFIRVRLNAMINGLPLLGRDGVRVAMVGERSASPIDLIQKLKNSSIALVVNSDAPWNSAKHRQAIVRPFAASQTATFAVGTAFLARASGCPIVLCVPDRIDENTVRLTWHGPIWVPKEGGHSADAAATNLLLDMIEKKIGEDPERYVRPIGQGRRWNANEGLWEITSPDAPMRVAKAAN